MAEENITYGPVFNENDFTFSMTARPHAGPNLFAFPSILAANAPTKLADPVVTAGFNRGHAEPQHPLWPFWRPVAIPNVTAGRITYTLPAPYVFRSTPNLPRQSVNILAQPQETVPTYDIQKPRTAHIARVTFLNPAHRHHVDESIYYSTVEIDVPHAFSDLVVSFLYYSTTRPGGPDVRPQPVDDVLGTFYFPRPGFPTFAPALPTLNVAVVAMGGHGKSSILNSLTTATSLDLTRPVRPFGEMAGGGVHGTTSLRRFRLSSLSTHRKDMRNCIFQFIDTAGGQPTADNNVMRNYSGPAVSLILDGQLPESVDLTRTEPIPATHASYLPSSLITSPHCMIFLIDSQRDHYRSVSSKALFAMFAAAARTFNIPIIYVMTKIDLAPGCDDLAAHPERAYEHHTLLQIREEVAMYYRVNPREILFSIRAEAHVRNEGTDFLNRHIARVVRDSCLNYLDQITPESIYPGYNIAGQPRPVSTSDPRTCLNCTYINPPRATICEICEHPFP